jgi:plasmid stabilization system protein ParE
MIKLIVRRAARLDVRLIFEWYEAEEVGLGARFLTELGSILERARSMPRQFPEVGNSLQRALLHRFPYGVYFLSRADAVVVLAVLHQHRNPSEWQRRAKSERAG